MGIAPNLVTADGSVPNIEQIHLHHATWLSEPGYGNGPFFAAGEEKTIARFPVGYGMPVGGSDVWYFVSMVHNEAAAPETGRGKPHDLDAVPRLPPRQPYCRIVVAQARRDNRDPVPARRQREHQIRQHLAGRRMIGVKVAIKEIETHRQWRNYRRLCAPSCSRNQR